MTEAEKKAKELYPDPYIRGMATRFATELKDSITLRRKAFIEGANWQAQQSDGICSTCGKYRKTQGNGILHQLCECGAYQAQSEWVHADKLAEIIVRSLDAYARGVNRVEYGLPLDPDTKSFDDPLAMDLKIIVLEVLSQSTKNK